MALSTPYPLGSVAYAGANVPSVQVTPVQYETQAKLVTLGAVPADGLIVVAVAFDVAQPTVVVTDSAGNVYTAVADIAAQNPSGLVVQLWSCLDAKALPAGGVITVSLPGAPADSASGIIPAAVPAPNYLCVAAAAVTGTVPSQAVDIALGATGSGTGPNSGSAGTGMANEVLFGAIGWLRTANPGNAESLTWGGSFTGLADAEAQNGTAGRAGLFFGYRVVTSTGSYGAAGTLGNADQWTAVVASYRAESIVAGGEIYINGVPLTAGRVGSTPSSGVNRIEIRGLVDEDGQLYTDVTLAAVQLTVNDVNNTNLLNAVNMDYRQPGVWGFDALNWVWVHGNGPWSCTVSVITPAAVVATYRFTTVDTEA
jgi:hypothetical protein